MSGVGEGSSPSSWSAHAWRLGVEDEDAVNGVASTVWYARESNRALDAIDGGMMYKLQTVAVILREFEGV